jgi:hypothetical protein
MMFFNIYLLTGMIEKVAISPTKNAIQNIARLLHNAAENKKKMEEEKRKQKELLERSRSMSFMTRSLYPRIIEIEPVRKSEPVSVPGVGTVDKIAIAQQIAAALVAQGRTNVSQEELETLINAVVGMAEASKNCDKPVTTADFVKGLTNSSSNDSSNNFRTKTPEIEKTIDHVAKIESLSDSDLKALLQNFKELTTEEQHGLINFLKKLEATDSARVEKLRAYVNLGPISNSPLKSMSPVKEHEESSRIFRKSASPFSTRKGNHNPCDDENKWKPKLDIFADEDEEDKLKKFDEKSKSKLDLSDDDDDYTLEDIYKAADKNVNENAKKRSFSRSKSNSPKSWSRSRSHSPPFKKSDYSKSSDPNVILNETKRLIANIMGDLPSKYISKSHLSPLSENPQLPNQVQSISLLQSGSASSNIPNNFNQNYGLNSIQTNTQLPYSANQFQNFTSQQPQSYNNNSGFLNNGYNNFNQGFNNMGNQNQYSGVLSNPYPQSNYGGSFGGPQSVRPSSSYSQQPFGNYSQQQRFY